MRMGLIQRGERIAEIDLRQGARTVGRAQGNKLVIDDASVSVRHAVLYLEAGQPYVEDLGSAAGTFINGDRVVGRALLRDGDRLRFGQFEIELRSIPDSEPVVSSPRPARSTGAWTRRAMPPVAPVRPGPRWWLPAVAAVLPVLAGAIVILVHGSRSRLPVGPAPQQEEAWPAPVPVRGGASPVSIPPVPRLAPEGPARGQPLRPEVSPLSSRVPGPSALETEPGLPPEAFTAPPPPLRPDPEFATREEALLYYLDHLPATSGAGPYAFPFGFAEAGSLTPGYGSAAWGMSLERTVQAATRIDGMQMSKVQTNQADGTFLAEVWDAKARAVVEYQVGRVEGLSRVTVSYTEGTSPSVVLTALRGQFGDLRDRNMPVNRKDGCRAVWMDSRTAAVFSVDRLEDRFDDLDKVECPVLTIASRQAYNRLWQAEMRDLVHTTLPTLGTTALLNVPWNGPEESIARVIGGNFYSEWESVAHPANVREYWKAGRVPGCSFYLRDGRIAGCRVEHPGTDRQASVLALLSYLWGEGVPADPTPGTTGEPGAPEPGLLWNPSPELAVRCYRAPGAQGRIGVHVLYGRPDFVEPFDPATRPGGLKERALVF